MATGKDSEESSQRLKTSLSLAKWLKFSGISPGNFDAFVHLILKEQFINACSEYLVMYLVERGPKGLVGLTIWAHRYLIAHKQQLGGKSKTTVQPRRVDQKNTVQTRFVTRTPEVAAVLPLSRFWT